MSRTPHITPAERRAAILAGTFVVSGGSDDEPTEDERPIRERLAELADLLANEETRRRYTDAELGDLHRELKAMHKAVRGGEAGIDPNDTALLGQIAGCVAATFLETAGRYTLAAANADEIAKLEAVTLADESEDESEDGPEDDEDEPDAEPDAEAEPDVDVEVDVVAASKKALPGLKELRSRDPRPDVPAVPTQAGKETLVTLADGRRTTYSEYMDFVSRTAADTLGRVNEHIVLGKVAMLPPGAPRINSRTDSAETMTRKLEEAVGLATSPASWGPNGEPMDALLASGGWSTPAPVVYDLAQISTAERPILNALPSIGVDRGGLTFVRPPAFADIIQGGPTVTNAATGVWTNDIDTTPGNTVKSHQTIPAGVPRTVQLDAIYQQLAEGVLMARAYPEWVRVWAQLSNAAWAQEAERHLLDQISASAITKHVVQATLGLGAARELIRTAVTLAAGERNRQRMDPEAPVRALYPNWVIDLIASDLVISGVNFVDSSPLLVARNYFSGQLRNANINASFYIDERTGSGQLFAAQTGSDNSVTKFRTHAEWYLWHEGAFVVGNGGELNLGIVRDATLVNTNDFRVFSESFEAVFDRGVWAYRVRQEVCANGAAADLFDTASLCSIS